MGNYDWDFEDTYYINRTLCTVLKEMRALDKVKNYSGLRGLIEEAQSMANAMESKLEDLRDLKDIKQKIKRARQTLKKLREEKEELESK